MSKRTAVWELWLVVTVLVGLFNQQLPFYSNEGHMEEKIQLLYIFYIVGRSSSTRELPKNDIKKIFLSVPGESKYEKLLLFTIWP